MMIFYPGMGLHRPVLVTPAHGRIPCNASYWIVPGLEREMNDH